MPMILYKTHDMEGSIRKMAKSNKQSVVMMWHQNEVKIRPRLNMVKDIDSGMLKPWIPESARNIQFLGYEGLLYYYHHNSAWKLPASDAMLFIEMPHSLEQYGKCTENVRDECIIYCPPDWTMFESILADKYPSVEKCEKVVRILKKFKGRELPKLHQSALDQSGLYKEFSVVFTGKEFEEVSRGISEKLMRHALKSLYYKKYRKYHPYRITYEDETDKGFWDILKNELPEDSSTKLLRGDELRCCYGKGGIKNRVRGFKTFIKQKCREKKVLQYKPIYVVDLSHRLTYSKPQETHVRKMRGFNEMRDLLLSSKDYNEKNS